VLSCWLCFVKIDINSFVRLFYKLLFVILLCVCFSANSRAEGTKIRVLASIKPLTLIAEAILGDRGEIITLLPPSASPHSFQLSVNDMRSIAAADVLFWVGPELEPFLSKPFRASSKLVLTSSLVPAVHWPALDDSHHEEDGHGHAHSKDFHLWLDPHNVIAVARVLATQLATIDPEGNDFYQHRVAVLTRQLKDLDKQLQHHFKPLQQQGFIVYHRAYTHLFSRYGLKQVGVITHTPDSLPGVRHISNLYKREGVECIFGDYGHRSPTAVQLSKRLNIPLIYLDPLGERLEIGEGSVELIQKISEEVSQCLQSNGLPAAAITLD